MILTFLVQVSACTVPPSSHAFVCTPIQEKILSDIAKKFNFETPAAFLDAAHGLIQASTSIEIQRYIELVDKSDKIDEATQIAMFQLGVRYLLGKEVEQGSEIGITLLAQALGISNLETFGVEKDRQEESLLEKELRRQQVLMAQQIRIGTYPHGLVHHANHSNTLTYDPTYVATGYGSRKTHKRRETRKRNGH